MKRGLAELYLSLDRESIGKRIYQLVTELYPIHRSITGNGLRRTMRKIKKYIPLKIHEVPTGTRIYDWVVPEEWNIRDAYIKTPRGKKIADFKKCNLHVVAYSVPVRKKLPLGKLKKHLFTLPDRPDWVPYRYAFHEKTWGFCLSHNDFLKLEKGSYEVRIDSSLKRGSMTYGEYYIEGNQADEVLISCHACHPSLCNDNLSGVAVATILGETLTSISLRYSYRFLFLSATIGALAWLKRNEDSLSKIKHGVVLADLGDSGNSTYKKSRRGNAEVDRAFVHCFMHSGGDYKILDFFPYGYDERQYCSPGFNLPVGCLMRTPFGQYPEYHTSADNLHFVRPACLADSFFKCLSALVILENNRTYLSKNLKGEPHLGRRGLYRAIAGQKEQPLLEMAYLWVLNLSDGNSNLLDIAERSGLPFDIIHKAARLLEKKGLIREM